MREIKFRCTYSDGKNWIKKDFTLAELMNGECFDVLSDQPLLKSYQMKETYQFTGLKDGNEVEIYEGDIVRFKANYSSKPCGWLDGEVVFEENQWMLKNKNGLYLISEETDEFYYKSEVVGNIYENNQ